MTGPPAPARRGIEILVAFDGSVGAVDALLWAAGLAEARRRGLRVVVARGELHRVSARVDDWTRGLAEEWVENARQELRAHELEPASYEIADGNAVPALLERASGVAMIVLGSRGRSRPGGALLGSVGQQVVRHRALSHDGRALRSGHLDPAARDHRLKRPTRTLVRLVGMEPVPPASRRPEMPDTMDLTYDECRSVLDGNGLGKVAVSTPMGPRIIAVNYAVVGDSIVFRTSPSSMLGTYARNSTLAFEVGGTVDDEHRASSVVAVGRADIVDDPSEMRRLVRTRNPEVWGDVRRSTYFTMPWSALSGTRMRVAG